MKTPVVKNCVHCGASFAASPSEQKRRKFCSLGCAYAAPSRMAWKKPKERGKSICQHCGTVFTLHRQSGKGLYCSLTCARSHIGKITLETNRMRPLTGADNPRWSGYTKSRSRMYRRKAWRDSKIVVMARDLHCRLCSSCVDLEIHHIEPFSAAPLLAYDINNLILLCSSCHGRIKGQEKRWRKTLLALLARKSESPLKSTLFEPKPPF
jgi:hypothetical protein